MWPVLALALTTGAAPVFTNKTPATPPAVRRSSDAALRPGTAGSDTLYTYGGFSGATLADFGAYSALTNTWSAPALGLPARERHSMAYDPLHDLIVIVGGANGLSVFDTIYLISPTYSVSTPPLPGVRPSARIDAALHWAPVLRKFIYFGGQANVFGNNHVGDLWTLDVGDGGVTWSAITPTTGSAPTARGAVCSAWDPGANKLVMFGGEVNGPANSAEVWQFDVDAGSWSLSTPTGTAPSARSFCAGDWEPNLKELVVYGGQTAAPTGGLFSLNPATSVWTQHLPASTPGNLSDSAAAYSPQLGGILFFGGRTAGSTYTNNTWLLRFNGPPVVDAGPDFSIGEMAMAALSGFTSDPDLDPVTTAWSQTMGPAVVLSNPTLLAPTFTTPSVAVPTTLRFVLTGNDGFTPTADSVDVTVLNTLNDVPTANAGPDFTVDGGQLTTLMGAGTDPNMDPLTFGWSQLVGPVVTLGAPSSAVTTFTAPAVPVTTVLSFRLVVNDGMAPSLPDDVFITVNATPVVDAGVDAGSDAGVPDAGVPDAGVPDAGFDAGVADAGVDAGPADAGTDAGTIDAGEDAGTDAGVDDAGLDAGFDAGSGMTADAGATDAGPGDPRLLTVSCGCNQTPAALWWAAGLLLVTLRRRRIRHG